MMSLPQWKQVLVEQRQRKAAEERRRQAEQEARMNRMPAWKREILVRKISKKQPRSDQKAAGIDAVDPNTILNDDSDHISGTGVPEQNGESSLGEGGLSDDGVQVEGSGQGVSEEKIVSVQENIFVKWQTRKRSPPYERKDAHFLGGQHKSHSPRGVGIPNNIIIIEKNGGSGYDITGTGKEGVQGLPHSPLHSPRAQSMFALLREAKPEREVIIIEKDDTEDKSVPCTLSGKVNRLRGKFGDEPRAEAVSARTKVPEALSRSSAHDSRRSQHKGQRRSNLTAAGSMDSLLDVGQQPNEAQKRRSQFHYSSCENLTALDILPPYVIQKPGSDDSITVDTTPNIRPRSLSQSKMHENTQPTGKMTGRVNTQNTDPTSQQSTRESPKSQITNDYFHKDTSNKPSLKVKPVSVTKKTPVGVSHVHSSGQSQSVKGRHQSEKKGHMVKETGQISKDSGPPHSRNVPEELIQIIPTKATIDPKLAENQNDPVAAAIASIKAQSKNTFVVQPRRPAGQTSETKKEPEPSHGVTGHQRSGRKDTASWKDDEMSALHLPLGSNKKQDYAKLSKSNHEEQKVDSSFVIRPLSEVLKESASEYQSAKVVTSTEKHLTSKEQRNNTTQSSTSHTPSPVEPRDVPKSSRHANNTDVRQQSENKTRPGKKSPAPQPPPMAGGVPQGTGSLLKPNTAAKGEELPTTNIDDVEILAKSQDNNNGIHSGKTGSDQKQTRMMQSSPAGSGSPKTASPPSLDVSPIAPPRHKATVRKLTVADYVVIGGYEKLGKSSISKEGRESKKLKISFNDSPTTFEYPSEQSLLEEADMEGVQAPTGLRGTPSLTTTAGDKVTPGGLHSYQPKTSVRSDVVAGKQQSAAGSAAEGGRSPAEGHPVEVFAVKPLADSEAPMWSSSSSMASALLF